MGMPELYTPENQTAPTGLKFTVGKCAPLSPEAYKMYMEPAHIIAGISKDFDQCKVQISPDKWEEQPKVVDRQETECKATGIYEYHVCSTCCCKDGKAYRFKYAQRLDYVDAGKGNWDENGIEGKVPGGGKDCARWFDMTDWILRALVTSITTFDN